MTESSRELSGASVHPAPPLALAESLAAARLGIPTVATCYSKPSGECAVHAAASCLKPGKRALWRKHDATTDAAAIRQRYARWPAAGVKWVLTGNHAVIDVDAKNLGPETVTRWVLEYGPLRPTWADANGIDAGAHYVLTVPGGFAGVLTLGPGVEAFGRNTEIVMPPSPYYRGGRRAWQPGRSPADVALSEAPPWLLRKIRAAELRHDRPRLGRRTGPLTSAELDEFQQLFSGYGVQSSRRSRGLYCCPFHDDHAPSLSVDWRRGLFKCWAASCGERGSLGTLRWLNQNGSRAPRSTLR